MKQWHEEQAVDPTDSRSNRLSVYALCQAQQQEEVAHLNHHQQETQQSDESLVPPAKQPAQLIDTHREEREERGILRPIVDIR